MTSTLTRENRRLPPSGRRPGVTHAFAFATMLVTYLPFSAANASLGAIAADTGASTAQLQWVSDAFAVALSATVLSGGVLGDLLGRRRVTLTGLALTVVGAVTGLTAGWLPGATAVHVLWLGQALAGIGAGAAMSATLALIAAGTPTRAARERAISLWAAALVVGLGAGPFLASAVAARAGWHWLYAPVAVLAVAVAVLGARGVPESAAPEGRRLDVPGQVTAALGIAALTFGIIDGGTRGWTAPPTLAALAVAALSLAVFARIELTTPSPLLSLRLFRSGPFTAAGLAALAVLFTISGGLFVLSLFFTSQHLGTPDIALRLGCLFTGNAAASLAASPLQRTVGPRAVLLGGLALAGIGVATLLTVTDTTGLGGFAWRLGIVGAGSGLVMATTSAIAVESAPAALAGMAGAANNALRQLGAALGPAVLGVLLAGRLHDGGSPADAVHRCAAVLLAVFAGTAVVAAWFSIGRPRSA